VSQISNARKARAFGTILMNVARGPQLTGVFEKQIEDY
jgi:hypothetical protein